jgi:hypothetical protein
MTCNLYLVDLIISRTFPQETNWLYIQEHRGYYYYMPERWTAYLVSKPTMVVRKKIGRKYLGFIKWGGSFGCTPRANGHVPPCLYAQKWTEIDSFSVWNANLHWKCLSKFVSLLIETGKTMSSGSMRGFSNGGLHTDSDEAQRRSANGPRLADRSVLVHS